jgi:hypothetical protein
LGSFFEGIDVAGVVARCVAYSQRVGEMHMWYRRKGLRGAERRPASRAL